MREQGRASFEEWARSRQQTLVRTAFLVTGDFHRAEDLVQEALVSVATRWDTPARRATRTRGSARSSTAATCRGGAGTAARSPCEVTARAWG